MDVNEIYRLTGEGMMGVALRMLRNGKEELPYELQRQYENVEMLLMQYYRYNDSAMTGMVRSAVLELADDMLDCMAEKSAIRYEYSIRRNWHISNETLMVALSLDYDMAKGLSAELDAQLIVLFRQVWLSGKLDSNSIKTLRDFLKDEGRDFARKIVVWALMLKCIRHYDIRIVEMLMECDMAEACVAVVMIALACQKRIDCDLMSLDLFRRFMADSVSGERCAIVYNNVMRTFETQNIASEMRDKIFPVVKEQGMQLRDSSKGVQIFDENGLNPEWEEKLEESGIIDRMRKINDMQLNGADIHYESFQMMKASPFFMETAHWFFPFDIRFHQLQGLEEDDGRLGNLSQLLNLCDSDRYSLFLMLNGMGVNGLKDALGNLGLNNYSEIREQLGNDEKWKETMKLSFETEVRFAVMNLYRFYNLAPNHSDMKSPFSRMMPAEGSELGYHIVPQMVRYRAATVLFKARQWDAARRYFNSVVDCYLSEDAMIYQKMGYCSEKLQKWDVAVEDYEKSDIIVPDDIWTLRHQAYCRMQMGDSDLAAGLYRKVLEIDKKSVDAIVNLANIYLDAGDYADAKPLLYEMNFRRGSMDDERKLGYCLFMMGERDEAMRHFNKSCSNSAASAEDFMMRAVCSGENAHIAEACAFIYNVSAIMETVNSKEIAKMMEWLTDEERNRIKSDINKIILEQ